MKEKINSLFSSKMFQFVILVAVITAIPLTVMTSTSSEKKDIRQQASEIDSYISNCSPISGSYIPFGQTVTFSGEVYDNVAVSGTRTFSLVINYPDNRGNEIRDTGVSYYRLATDPPIKSGCVPLPLPIAFAATTAGKHTWYLTAQLKEYEGQGQLKSKESYFYVNGGEITPSCKKTGIDNFSVYGPCLGGYRYATYKCYDGYKGTLGEPTSCKSSLLWKSYAEKACADRSSCSSATPVPTSYEVTPKPTYYITPTPKYGTPKPTSYWPNPTRYTFPTPRPRK